MNKMDLYDNNRSNIIMEEKFKGLDFEEVHDMLGCCKNTEEKIEIYQRLVEIGENLCAQDGRACLRI